MYLKPSQTLGLEFYAKTVNNWITFAVFAEISVLDVWPGS